MMYFCGFCFYRLCGKTTIAGDGECCYGMDFTSTASRRYGRKSLNCLLSLFPLLRKHFWEEVLKFLDGHQGRYQFEARHCSTDGVNTTKKSFSTTV